MLNKNITKQAKSIVEIQVSATWDMVQPIWDTTLQKLAADLELSGFRKGMVPLNMAEVNLGTRLQEEVAKAAMPQFLIEALKGSDVVPIDYPRYKLTSFVKGQNFSFMATVTNRPVVAVGNYKAIKVSRVPVKPATEAEIAKAIEDLFKRFQARAQVAQTPPSTANGSMSFNQPPVPSSAPVSMNDDFAKAMGAKDLADLKVQVRKDLDAQINYNAELDHEEAILQEVEKITTVEIPDVLVQDELNRMLVSLQRRVADMGMLMEDYLKSQNKTLDQIKTEWNPQASKNVRMELGLAEIARTENITITDTELQAEIDKITDARIKQQFDYQEPRLQLRHSLRQVRTLDLLKKLVSA